MHPAILAPEARKPYILAGRAKVTVVSSRTGTRFTYKIVAKETTDRHTGEKTTLHFVSVLCGPDNGADYTFLGTIFDSATFRHGARSSILPSSPSAQAWVWLWQNITSDKAEVWHSGECGRCGRELTDPESIARGLGPTCAEKG